TSGRAFHRSSGRLDQSRFDLGRRPCWMKLLQQRCSAGHVWCRHRGSLEEREAGRTSTGAHQDRAVHVHAWRDNVRLDLLEQRVSDERWSSAGEPCDNVSTWTVREEFHMRGPVDRDYLLTSTGHCEPVSLRYHHSRYCRLVVR